MLYDFVAGREVFGSRYKLKTLMKTFEARIATVLIELGGCTSTDVFVTVARDASFVAVSRSAPARRLEVDESIARGLIDRGASWMDSGVAS